MTTDEGRRFLRGRTQTCAHKREPLREVQAGRATNCGPANRSARICRQFGAAAAPARLLLTSVDNPCVPFPIAFTRCSFRHPSWPPWHPAAGSRRGTRGLTTRTAPRAAPRAAPAPPVPRTRPRTTLPVRRWARSAPTEGRPASASPPGGFARPAAAARVARAVRAVRVVAPAADRVPGRAAESPCPMAVCRRRRRCRCIRRLATQVPEACLTTSRPSRR
jgi:hypothetical protein